MHTASLSGSLTAVRSYSPCMESSDRTYAGVLAGVPGWRFAGRWPTGRSRSVCFSAADNLLGSMTTCGCSLPFLMYAFRVPAPSPMHLMVSVEADGAKPMVSSAHRPEISLPRCVTGSSLREGPAARIIPATLARRLQHVPDAADRVDERVTARVDLLAQVADVQLDNVRLAAEVVVPD